MSADIQRLNQRLANAQPSATYRIMDRVAERRAQGANIISLCAGEPDFDTPKHVREASMHAIEHGHTRYTQVAGVRSLREAVAAKFRRENGLDDASFLRLQANPGRADLMCFSLSHVCRSFSSLQLIPESSPHLSADFS